MMIGNWDVGIGDRVTILTPHGSKLAGKVRILNREQGLAVLNGGGKHGTPLTATERNICKVTKAKAGAREWGLLR